MRPQLKQLIQLILGTKTGQEEMKTRLAEMKLEEGESKNEIITAVQEQTEMNEIKANQSMIEQSIISKSQQ